MISIFQKVHSILNQTSSFHARLARSIWYFFDIVPTKLEAIYVSNLRQSIQLDLQNKLLVHIVGLLWSQDTEQLDDEIVDDVNASSARLLKMNGFADSPETRTKVEAVKVEASKLEEQARYDAARAAAKERMAMFGTQIKKDGK